MPQSEKGKSSKPLAESNGYEVRKTIRFKGGMMKFIEQESRLRTGGDVSKYVKELIKEKMNQKNQDQEKRRS